MSEKKQVLYDLKSTYSGPFLMEDFYAEVEKWGKDNDFEKERKRKTEHVTKNGKSIEWHIEFNKHLDELHHSVIILRVTADNLKEVTITKNRKKMRINNGDVFVDVNAFIESHIHGSFYQMKPVYYLMRTLVDKYIYNFWTGKYDGVVNSSGRELFKAINSFFNLQKYKYE